MPGFKQPEDDWLGLPVDENHLVIEWEGPGRILFSYARRGKGGLSCHFASNSDGLRHIKTAIDDFAHYVRETMPWCKMLLAVVGRPSVARLIQKCDFHYVTSNERADAYARKL